MRRTVGCLAAAIGFSLTSALDAQTRPDTDTVLPGSLAERVTAEVARHLQIEPRTVVLQWGRFAGYERLTDQTTFALRGQPTATQYSVVFTPREGQPMAVSVRVGQRLAVPLATRPLFRGQLVREDDVEWGSQIVWGTEQFEQSTDLPVGWTVRTSIGAGERVSRPAARPPHIIQAGQQVEVFWLRGRIRVTLFGRAMNSADAGDRVRIRLDDRRGNARGVATRDGRVRLIDKLD